MGAWAGEETTAANGRETTARCPHRVGEGRWEVIFETQVETELRAHLRGLREARIDESMLRIDTLCGRLAQPTTYRLSRFMTHPAAGS